MKTMIKNIQFKKNKALSWVLLSFSLSGIFIFIVSLIICFLYPHKLIIDFVIIQANAKVSGVSIILIPLILSLPFFLIVLYYGTLLLIKEKKYSKIRKIISHDQYIRNRHEISELFGHMTMFSVFWLSVTFVLTPIAIYINNYKILFILVEVFVGLSHKYIGYMMLPYIKHKNITMLPTRGIFKTIQELLISFEMRDIKLFYSN